MEIKAQKKVEEQVDYNALAQKCEDYPCLDKCQQYQLKKGIK